MSEHEAPNPLIMAISTARAVAARAGEPFAALVSKAASDLVEVLGDDKLEPAVMEQAAREQFEGVRALLAAGVAANDVAPVRLSPTLIRQTVQHGIPVEAVMDVCQLGHARVWRCWLDLVFAQISDPAQLNDTVRWSSELVQTYAGALMKEAARQHTTERELWLNSLASTRRSLVDTILTDRSPERVQEAGRRIGYDLSRWHTGLVIWHDPVVDIQPDHVDLERTARALAETLGESRNPLLVVSDESTLWVWVATIDKPTPPQAASPAQRPTTRVAIGQPAPGPAGFRATHDEAIRTRALTLHSGLTRPLICHADVDVMTLIDTDLERLRRHVRRHLGRLAADTNRARQLRRALRAFLQTGTIQAAAHHENLHRNTLNRQLALAESLRGRPLEDDRLGLALALEITETYGPAVLTRKPQP